MSKLTTLQDCAALIQDNCLLAIGGNVLHRSPMALVREIARQGRRGLRLVKTAGAMDVDLLCFAGCVESVDAGFISYESEFGLASHYRRAVQSGSVRANEHACYTVISALRAASTGAGFVPVRGLVNSDLIDANPYFARIADPFTGEQTTVVQAIRPDVAILHVQEADANGNASILPPQYEDVLLSRAARKVIITAERIVPSTYFAYAKKKADIPHFMVEAVVHAPGGAFPCSCLGSYDVDSKEVRRFQQLADQGELTTYLSGLSARDGAEQRRIGI